MDKHFYIAMRCGRWGKDKNFYKHFIQTVVVEGGGGNDDVHGEEDEDVSEKSKLSTGARILRSQ